MNYQGIKTEFDKDGKKKIIVRFKHLGIDYNRKNFTKLFGCKTETQAYKTLQEIKVELSKGEDPFLNSPETLDFIWGERFKRKVARGDWGEMTYTNYEYFYAAYIKESIGWMKVGKIEHKHIEGVLDLLKDKKNGSKNLLKTMLKPLFKQAIIDKLIKENPFQHIPTFIEPDSRRKISEVAREDPLEMARQIYKAIPNFKVRNLGIDGRELENQMFFYLLLLTAHRMGELMHLTTKDCYFEENMIISPKTITKTKVAYKFPIPVECLDYLKSIKKGLLFPNIKRGSNSKTFKRLVRLTDIHLYHDQLLSMHDTRRLLTSVMIMDCKIDSKIADACLNHKDSTVQKHYLDIDYNTIVKSFKKYWGKIREEEEEEFTLDDIDPALLEMLKLAKKAKQVEELNQ